MVLLSANEDPDYSLDSRITPVDEEANLVIHNEHATFPTFKFFFRFMVPTSMLQDWYQSLR